LCELLDRASFLALIHHPTTRIDVSNARLLLIALICASPALLLFDGPIAHSIVAGVAASAMLILLRTMRPGETSFFLSIVRPIVLFAAIPAIWMLIQVIPLGVLANPIWNSAEVARGQPIVGAISIDIGAGVMALGQYLTLMAIFFLSAAVSVDRQRAELTLFSLMVATAAIALVALVTQLVESKGPTDGAALLMRMQALDCAALGVVIACSTAIRTLERYETRHANPDRSVPILMSTFVACAAALAICVAALMLGAKTHVLVATAYGAAAVAAVVFIRRLAFGPWGILAIAVPSIALAAFLAVGNAAYGTKSFSLIFATQAPVSLTNTSQRILADSPVWGIGAGTFSAIAPIYSDIDETIPQPAIAPSAAAAATIELGSPVMWFIVIATIGATTVLFRAALQRGRDSFYPAAGAAALLTLLFLSFMNAGLLGMATAMVTAATVGLAFAQSKSRSVHR
jgi:hypothetical protein